MQSSIPMPPLIWGFAMHPDPVVSGTFAEALFLPDMPPPPGLTGRDAKPPTRRFAVYRNNVTVSLVDALAAIFPTVQNLVGKDFFRAMARLYVADHPPTSPLLFTYGESFPAFIEGFPPAAELPFLADVARVERLWLDAFHAADAPPLDPAALAHIPAEVLPDIRFQVHPATRFTRLGHAAGTICTKDRKGSSLEALDPMSPETVLITRPGFDVAIEILSESGAAFVEKLISGGTLGEACLVVSEEQANIPDFIGLALTSGAFTAIHTNPKSRKS